MTFFFAVFLPYCAFFLLYLGFLFNSEHRNLIVGMFKDFQSKVRRSLEISNQIPFQLFSLGWSLLKTSLLVVSSSPSHKENPSARALFNTKWIPNSTHFGWDKLPPATHQTVTTWQTDSTWKLPTWAQLSHRSMRDEKWFVPLKTVKYQSRWFANQ